MNEAGESSLEKSAVRRAQQALMLATASLPHLAGLARLVRLKASDKVSVAAVSSSGLIVIRPELFARMPLTDAAYILAHELMHLALDTHGRQGRADPLIANFAHDYIINDILTEAMHRPPPLDGLFREDAREKSFEELVVELSSGYGAGRARCWRPDPTDDLPAGGALRAPSPMTRALEEAGLVKPPPLRVRPPIDEALRRGDLISQEKESEFEPELTPQVRKSMSGKIRQAGAKAASLATLRDKIDAANQAAPASGDSQRADAMIQALRDAYHTPWQLALQRWMDAVAPGQRTYARPSRRGSLRDDIVLPGRRRDGWTLHIILDTSGSMSEYLPRALGAIAYFCESTGVYEVHLVQCDEEVTRDEWVEPAELAEYGVSGFGYSDMSPAMQHLADDPEVAAALILTDGYIDFLEQEPPYHTLWVLLGDLDPDFEPPYGQVLLLD